MKEINNKDAIMSPSIMLGIDGDPLVTEKDFMLEKLRCESKIVTYQAMNTVLAKGFKNYFKKKNENK